MRNKILRHIFTLLFFALCVTACDNGNQSNDTNTNEPAQPLPTEFTDIHGGKWTCPEATGSSELTGEISINTGTTVSRADIVQIQLLKLENDTLQLISHKCINNILFYLSDFSLPYTIPSDEQVPAEGEDFMYVLVSHYFKKRENDVFQNVLGPDGWTQVVSNELVNDIKISLDPY